MLIKNQLENNLMTNRQVLQFYISNDPEFIKAVKKLVKERDKLRSVRPLERKIMVITEFYNREFVYPIPIVKKDKEPEKKTCPSDLALIS